MSYKIPLSVSNLGEKSARLLDHPNYGPLAQLVRASRSYHAIAY
jgi:hypothetical protein